MAERSEELARHIEAARGELGSNLHELEDKFKREVDWKTHFDRHPMALLGAAFAGGVLVAAITSGSNPRVVNRPIGDQRSTPFESTRRNIQVSQGWATMEQALVSLALTKARDALNTFLPGFSEHYDKAERGDFRSNRPQQRETTH